MKEKNFEQNYGCYSVRSGIVVLVIAIVMMATIQGVAALPVGAFAAKGTIQYENGTTCPYGWDVWTENLDQSQLEGQPWHVITKSVPPGMDYYTGGETVADSDRINVTVTSSDGSYYGTNTMVASEAFNGVNVIINITVHEIPTSNPGSEETFTKYLASGWNLISLPLTPGDSNTSYVLGSIPYDAAKSYNIVTHQFEDATTMDPGIGYFVHMMAAGTWSYNGTAYTSMTTNLSQGLNMIGWTNTSVAIPDALASITGNYRYVAHWNATSQGYEVYEPNAPVGFNDFTTMERGEGYFIAATLGCMLELS